MVLAGRPSMGKTALATNIAFNAARIYKERRNEAGEVEVADGAVVGFNLMGIRYRHELCRCWIETGRPVRDVLQDLSAANFDPELHRGLTVRGLEGDAGRQG